MKTWIKRTLTGVVGIAVLGVAGLALGAYLGDRKAMRHVEIAVQPVAIPADAASIERGRYLYATRGCADCHGSDGAGAPSSTTTAAACMPRRPTSARGRAASSRRTGPRIGCARSATA
jgi:mono/diheme cytochrome c family protein